MLKGRLGLETARVPHADRHGLIWLERGELCVVNGCLHFCEEKTPLPLPRTKFLTRRSP